MIVFLALSLATAWSHDPLETLLTGGRVVGTGTALDGTIADIRFLDDRIGAIGPKLEPGFGQIVDMSGKWLAPAFIDSHVHLALYDVRKELLDHGVTAVVDLASPLGRKNDVWTPWLDVRIAGPMLTAPNGYPLNSWGANGFGLVVTTPEDARRAVAELAKNGAELVKLPFGHAPELDDATARAAIDEAHARKMKVVAHALSDRAAKRAGELGADVLAHVPTGALSDDTVELWSKRAVIATLAAFGGSAVAIENLRRLRAAGARVLYGTDLGNTQDARIQPDELALMVKAGMDGAAILAAGTRDAAALWGFDQLGALAPNKAASILVLDADPRVDPSTLSRPTAVYIRGYRR